MPSFTSIHKHRRLQRHKKSSIYQEALDIIVDFAVLLAPLSLLPQLVIVWREGSNAGVAISTWLLTGLITLPLILYDLSHKAYKLILMHVLIVIISFGIVVGLIIR